ncbi:hypothetical protein AMTRI_Chr13g124690 [Amborella trichopoda]
MPTAVDSTVMLPPPIEASTMVPPHLRPKPDTVKYLEDVPVIDLSPLQTPNSHDLADIVAQVHISLKEWGFFVVVNHGVAPGLWPEVIRVMSEFSKLSFEEKRKVARNPNMPWGYNESDHTNNIRDWAEVFDFMLNKELSIPASLEPDCQETSTLHNQWPENPADFRKVCEEFTQAASKLMCQLLELIALSLGLPADRFNRYLENHMNYSRINYFPICPTPELVLGKGAHKDHAILTLLTTNEVSGLELKRKSDGEWLRLRPIPDSVVVIMAGVLQVWSNDEYECIVHRVVVNSENERFSMVTVASPSYHVMVKPIEELVTEENPSKFKEYKWGDFFMSRRVSNLDKTKTAIQITDFKLGEERKPHV